MSPNLNQLKTPRSLLKALSIQQANEDQLHQLPASSIYATLSRAQLLAGLEDDEDLLYLKPSLLSSSTRRYPPSSCKKPPDTRESEGDVELLSVAVPLDLLASSVYGNRHRPKFYSNSTSESVEEEGEEDFDLLAPASLADNVLASSTAGPLSHTRASTMPSPTRAERRWGDPTVAGGHSAAEIEMGLDSRWERSRISRVEERKEVHNDIIR